MTRLRMSQVMMVLAVVPTLVASAAAQEKRRIRSPEPVSAPEATAALPVQSSTDPRGYRELVDQGLSEYGVQNYNEARALFQRAHELAPSARTHRALGMIAFELRDYAESISQLEAALASPVKKLDDKLRAATEALLKQAQGFVARIVVESKPPATRLVVDGVPQALPAGEALVLRGGEHTFELQAPGYLVERRVLQVVGGEQKTLTIVFTKQAIHPSEAPTPHWYRNPWLWTGIGVVVAGAAVGLGVGLARRDDGGTADAYGGSANAVLTGPESRGGK